MDHEGAGHKPKPQLSCVCTPRGPARGAPWSWLSLARGIREYACGSSRSCVAMRERFPWKSPRAMGGWCAPPRTRPLRRARGGHPRTGPQQKHAQDQRRTRRQPHVRAFLFPAAGHRLGEVERVPWEVALTDGGGNGTDATLACGLTAMPQGTKALGGWSAEAAWGSYRHWQQQRHTLCGLSYIVGSLPLLVI